MPLLLNLKRQSEGYITTCMSSRDLRGSRIMQVVGVTPGYRTIHKLNWKVKVFLSCNAGQCSITCFQLDRLALETMSTSTRSPKQTLLY